VSHPNDAVCFIVGAGSIDPAHRLSPRLGDLIIAADAGWLALERMGLTPDLVVGDFDSLGSRPDHPNTIVLPTVKDNTDMHAAIRLGQERGYTRFALYGGTGGRLAHTLANLQLLDGLSRQGCRGFLIGEGTVAAAVTDGSLSFPAHMTGYLSVFCSGAPAQGVTLSGLKYTMENGSLSAGFPLGVSNHFTGQRATITVENGSVLALWERNNALPSRQRICKKEV
jgi:thiamine pyrophosphokinase